MYNINEKSPNIILLCMFNSRHNIIISKVVDNFQKYLIREMNLSGKQHKTFFDIFGVTEMSQFDVFAWHDIKLQ